MKAFENVTNKTYTFSSCELCEAQCCNGAMGSTFSQILLDEFKTIAPYFPILFIKGNLGYLKAVVLLSDGKVHCPYITDMKCTIYENRPSVCRTYPLSTNIDNQIYIDTNCPAINEEGVDIVKEGKITKEFDQENLHNYKDKFINTHLYLEKFNKEENLTELFTINSEIFYSLKNGVDDEIIKYHHQSLKHFEKEYYN